MRNWHYCDGMSSLTQFLSGSARDLVNTRFFVLLAAMSGVVLCACSGDTAPVSSETETVIHDVSDPEEAGISRFEMSRGDDLREKNSFSLQVKNVYLPPPAWEVPPQNWILFPEFQLTEIGDVTGDGRNDVVATLSGTREGYLFLIYRQNESGALVSPQTFHYPFPVNELPAWLRLSDMNRDGVLDPVAFSSNSIKVLLSQPDGSKRWRDFKTGDLNADMKPVICDLDRDGNNDVVMHFIPGSSSEYPPVLRRPRITVFFGDGQGGIARQLSRETFGTDPYDGENAKGLAVGDFDGNGDYEIAMNVKRFHYWEQRISYHLEIFPYSRASGIGSPTTFQQDPRASYLAAGDFNGDRRDDLAFSIDDVEPLKTRISTLLQNPDGTLSFPPVERLTTTGVISLNASDLDRDGDSDLLVAHNGASRVGMLFQHGGMLNDAVYAGYPGGAGWVGESGQAAGDINGDGCSDVVVASRFDGLVVLHGTGCSPRRRSTGGPNQPFSSELKQLRSEIRPYLGKRPTRE